MTTVDRHGAQLGTDDAGTPGVFAVVWAWLGSALAWTFHLVVSYTAIAYSCTTGKDTGARITLVVTSLLALGMIAHSAYTARARWHVSRRVDRPSDDAWDARMGERTARVSFMMVLGLFLAVVFSLSIIYQTITAFMSPLCEPGIAP